MLKSFFHWKVLLNVLAAAIVFAGLVWLTFRWLEFHTNHGEEIPVPNVVNRSVHDAIKVLDDSGLEYEVDSGKYNPKYRPFQVLAIYPLPGSRVKLGRSIILRVNPKTYAKVSVPDVIDRYKGLAFRQLEQVGLKVGDTLYEPSIQKDAILRMMLNGTVIKPGTLLPRFSTIDVVIGSGPKRNITIPNVVGLTVAEAERVIKQSLFEVGLVEHEGGGHDPADIVYYQDPEAFDIRDQGMQIDLWASKKTPAEMSAKIEQLNSIYRVKIDTTVPPPNYNEPVYVPQPRPVQPRPETAVETPTAKTQQTSTNNKPKADEKPKTNTTTTPAKPVTEKPKTKKVVVE